MRDGPAGIGPGLPAATSGPQTSPRRVADNSGQIRAASFDGVARVVDESGGIGLADLGGRVAGDGACGDVVLRRHPAAAGIEDDSGDPLVEDADGVRRDR